MKLLHTPTTKLASLLDASGGIWILSLCPASLAPKAKREGERE